MKKKNTWYRCEMDWVPLYLISVLLKQHSFITSARLTEVQRI